MFASHFAFNLQYNEKCVAVMEYIRRYLWMKHGLARECFAKEQYIKKQGKSHKKFIGIDCGLI